MLSRGAGGAWDANLIESAHVFWDAPNSQWAMVYVGYSGGAGDAGAIGLATSASLTSGWSKSGSNPILSATGVGGDPDEGSVTAPFIWIDGSTYHLFYLGCSLPGYEQGAKKICRATATSLTGPWTRHGAVVSPSGTGWRGSAVWHAQVVQVGATYYLFFNATDFAGSPERVGYATSSDLATWTVDDVNSPLLGPTSGMWDNNFIGDPCVYQGPDGTWWMAFYGSDGITRDGLAYTAEADFPLGWVKYNANPVLQIGAAGDIDASHAGKPSILLDSGTYYHYYTAYSAGTAVTQIALASGPIP